MRGGDAEAGPLFLRARPCPAPERSACRPAAGRPAPRGPGAVAGPCGQRALLAVLRPGAWQVLPRPVPFVRVPCLPEQAAPRGYRARPARGCLTFKPRQPSSPHFSNLKASLLDS